MASPKTSNATSNAVSNEKAQVPVSARAIGKEGYHAQGRGDVPFRGIFISGDFDDIDKLYDAVWEVAAPIAGDDGYRDPLHFPAVNVLGFCYDLRHCYMVDREVMLHENGVKSGMRLEGKAIPTKDVRHGVSILWTEALFNCAMLRVLCERRQRKLSKGKHKSDDVSAQARYDVSINHVVLYQSLVYGALAQTVPRTSTRAS